MAIRITLECGHASMLRVRTTPEGYTHDWEVFVRGVDNADIHHYVEKVVFFLHETFPKPKRVLKEPPFVVKESGYAGFVIPIHIYLRNKDEPKKIQIQYDLQLQPSGPAINNTMRHTEIIHNPSDEFRRKLLKGGAVPISNSEGPSDKGEAKTPSMVGKPKLSGSESKKHRLNEPKTSNSFADLFGPPIKTAKISPDNKNKAQPEKSSTLKPAASSEKLDKMEKNAKTKESPHKEKKDKTDDKKDKKLKDPSKERNRSKEKSKRPPSPGSKSHSSPASKRAPSPVPAKKPSSPVPPIKSSASPKPKEKEVKKAIPDKEKEKEKEKDKAKDASKGAMDVSKSEKKKMKKHKEDRDKDRKEKYKERERSSAKETPKSSEKKNDRSDKPEKQEKPEKEKSQEYKSAKDGRKSPKPAKESEKVKEEKSVKVEKAEKTEKSEKMRDGRSDKDRQKHKHKKREKKDKRDSSREREKKEKREKSKVATEKQSNVVAAPIANPLSTLLAEMPERDSSDSAPSVDDDSFPEPKSIPSMKKEPESVSAPTLSADATKPPSPSAPAEVKKDRSDRSSRREGKPKGGKGEERENRKRKRRSESKGDDDHPAAKREKDRDHSTSPLLEPVSSSQSPVAVDAESTVTKDKEDRVIAEQTAEKGGGEGDAEQVAPDSTNSTLVESDTGDPPVFSEDYVSQLRDLQQKIMTLQDNTELQRVVQVIAETGQYEITKKTFDFDLCALDRRTVQRLQQFFSAS